MKAADYILKGNYIFDSISETPFAGYVAVNGNTIQAIGKNSDSYDALVGVDTKIIECGDRLIMPGMIDAHMHFFDGIFQNSKFMCRDLFGCTSAKACVEAINKFAKEHPDYERITGMGWFIPAWEDKTAPTKQMLDEIEPDRPVYLMCADGHSFWLNSRALEESEINPNRKLLFGEIVKDEKGEAAGLLHELDACSICTVNAQKVPENERKELILNFVESLNKSGFTSTTDVTVLPQPLPITDIVKAVGELEQENNLNLRLSIYPSLGTDGAFSIQNEYRNTFNSDKVRVPGLKAFVDGVHGNHTALVKGHYLDAPEKSGESFYDHEYYVSRVAAANKEGYGVKLHCCGELATIWALDAYENSNKLNGNENIRNSIEHVEIVDLENTKRFKDANVTAAMQPVHMMYQGTLLHDILGSETAQYEYAVKNLMDMGVNVAFSSDYPVAPFDPMINIYFAVTRCDTEGNPVEKDPTQEITMAQALRAYTYGSAYCVNMEEKVGTLEAGKLADIIVLDKNLFDVDPKDILTTKVDMTMVDGTIAYNNLI